MTHIKACRWFALFALSLGLAVSLIIPSDNIITIIINTPRLEDVVLIERSDSKVISVETAAEIDLAFGNKSLRITPRSSALLPGNIFANLNIPLSVYAACVNSDCTRYSRPVLGGNYHLPSPQRPGEVEMMATIFEIARCDFEWDDIEKKKGVYDFSTISDVTDLLFNHDILPMWILDYANHLYPPITTPEGRDAFTRFAMAGLEKFHGRGIVWEMWNEPDGNFWPPKANATQYFELASQVGRAVKHVYPNETFVGPALAYDLNWLDIILEMGMLEWFDFVTMHPYRFTNPETAAETYVEARRLVRRSTPEGRAPVSLVSGEWGYTTWNRGISEKTQAMYVVRELLSNQVNGMAWSIWYDWHDDGTDSSNPEDRFGLVQNEYYNSTLPFYPKPGYTVAKILKNVLNGFLFNKRIQVEDPEIYILLFSDPSHSGHVISTWTTRLTPVTIDIQVGPNLKLKVISFYGDVSSETSGNSGNFRLEISDEPTYVVVQDYSDYLYLVSKAPRIQLDFILKSEIIPISVPVFNPFSEILKFSLEVVISGNSNVSTVTVPAKSAARINLGLKLKTRHYQTAVLNFQVEKYGNFSQAAFVVSDADLSIAPFNLTTAVFKLNPHKRVEARVVITWGEERVEKQVSFDGKTPEFVSIENFDSNWENSAKFQVEITSSQGPLVFITPQSASIGYLNISSSALSVSGSAQAKLFRPSSFPVSSEFSLPVMALNYSHDNSDWSYATVNSESIRIEEGSNTQGFMMWCYGDGSKAGITLRFVDATGQTFQPGMMTLNYVGWKLLKIYVGDGGMGHWGGANDGIIHYPISWESYLAITFQPSTKGTVYFSSPFVTTWL